MLEPSTIVRMFYYEVVRVSEHFGTVEFVLLGFTYYKSRTSTGYYGGEINNGLTNPCSCEELNRRTVPCVFDLSYHTLRLEPMAVAVCVV